MPSEHLNKILNTDVLGWLKEAELSPQGSGQARSNAVLIFEMFMEKGTCITTIQNDLCQPNL